MFDRRQIDQSAAGHRPLRRVVRRQNLGLGLALKIGDLGLDLGAKLVRGLAHLPRDIRQLLWPKNKQRQHEQKSHLPKTEHESHHTAGVRSAATRAVSHLCFFPSPLFVTIVVTIVPVPIPSTLWLTFSFLPCPLSKK